MVENILKEELPRIFCCRVWFWEVFRIFWSTPSLLFLSPLFAAKFGFEKFSGPSEVLLPNSFFHFSVLQSLVLRSFLVLLKYSFLTLSFIFVCCSVWFWVVFWFFWNTPSLLFLSPLFAAECDFKKFSGSSEVLLLFWIFWSTPSLLFLSPLFTAEFDFKKFSGSPEVLLPYSFFHLCLLQSLVLRSFLVLLKYSFLTLSFILVCCKVWF